MGRKQSEEEIQCAEGHLQATGRLEQTSLCTIAQKRIPPPSSCISLSLATPPAPLSAILFRSPRDKTQRREAERERHQSKTGRQRGAWALAGERERKQRGCSPGVCAPFCFTYLLPAPTAPFFLRHTCLAPFFALTSALSSARTLFSSLVFFSFPF